MTSEFDSESASMTRTEQALRRVADMNRKTMIDLLIESVNEQNKLYYVVDTNQKWVCFNDIRQEEIGLKRSMLRRNRLETSDEMSLKRSMKWAWNARIER